MADRSSPVVVAALFAGRVLVRMVAMLLIVATVTFVVVRALPSSPVDIYVQSLQGSGLSYAAAEARASAVLNIDLSEPLGRQYLQFLSNLLHGDLGSSVSLSPGEPVLDLILARLPWTLFSVGIAMVVSFLLGMRLGVFAAYRRGSKRDHAITNLSAIFDATPPVVPGILLVFLLGVAWRVVPLDDLRGAYSPATTPGLNLPFLLSALQHVLAPAAIYVLTTIGGWTLAMRSTAISVLGEEHVVGARARGLSERRIRNQYVQRNARLPLITGFAMTFGFVLSGSVLIEQIFVYPGLGQLLYEALARRDYTVMQGVVIVTTVAVLICTAIADAAAGWLDPRTRTEQAR